MTDTEAKTRRYIFTVNNYSKKDLKRFHTLAESLEKHRYICYGLEVAGTGTPHIQGYIELNEAQRFTFLHNYFDFKRKGEVLKFHIQPAKGTAEQNRTRSMTARKEIFMSLASLRLKEPATI